MYCVRIATKIMPKNAVVCFKTDEALQKSFNENPCIKQIWLTKQRVVIIKDRVDYLKILRQIIKDAGTMRKNNKYFFEGDKGKITIDVKNNCFSDVESILNI